MDKSSEKYKELCKNPKFERRAARIWYRKLQEHNRRVYLQMKPPNPPEIQLPNVEAT